MKKLLVLLFMAGLANTYAQPASTDENWTPTVKFEKNEHDFGNIPEGPKVYHEFKFTNTGKEPVYITNAAGSCGCTKPEWKEGPVLPGKSSVIKVGFDSEKRPGNFTKTVTVTFAGGTNRDKSGTTKLYIKGNVEQASGKTEPAKQEIRTVKPASSSKKQGS